jgi:hypothetical protein
MSNMFDMGMFGMLSPNERKRILEGEISARSAISDKQPGFETQNRGSLQTAGGVNLVDREHRGRGVSVGTGVPSHLDPNYVPRNRAGKEYPDASAADIAAGKSIKLASGKQIVTPGTSAQFIAQSSATAKKPVVNTEYQDAIRRGGKGANVPQDLNWWQKLSGMFNSKFDLEGAKADWNKKGGFEGLMANPAFTMGLAFMQSAAEGKSLGAGALDNVIKAGGISHTYKKIIEDRKQEPIQATSADIAEVKGLLESMNIEDPSWIEKIIGKVKNKNVQAMFDIAAEDIAIELQKEMARLEKANTSGTPLVFDTRRKLKIIKRLKDQGKFKKVGGSWITAGTLESDVVIPTRATGGQVAQGKPYVVGEGGPEYFLPKESGKVLSNDDSRIFDMLLASNPQLQQVSRTRAEKILRNRFPEYFE